jgi:carbohydrate diacid regulator
MAVSQSNVVRQPFRGSAMDSLKYDNLLKELKSLTGLTLEVKADGSEEAQDIHAQLKSLISAYKEKYSQEHFLLSLLTEDSLPHIVAKRAKKLHIDPQLPRIMLLMDFKSPLSENTMEILDHLVVSKPKPLTIPINKHQLVLLKPVTKEETKEDFHHFSGTLVDTLNTEALVSVHISYSDSFTDLSMTGSIYKENALALEVGKLFHSDRKVYPNDKLGVGRLIKDIPLDTCRKFITEVFGNEAPKLLDSETGNIVNTFIHNNLNIAETARQLHMHRNTLLFRLEKIENATGLDLRNFEDALTFRIATMIVGYYKERNF